MATKEEVLNALRQIIDPDLGQDIVALDFVKNLAIDGGTVRFAIELTTPACPMKKQFREDAERLVRELPGVANVEVTMTAQKRKAASGGQQNLTSIDTIIAVASCKGGVGKSTIAAHLARVIQREGREVGLLDLDIHGPSFPTLFRNTMAEVYMQGDRIMPVDVDGLRTMSMGYLIGDRPAVMRGPMASGYAQQILFQTDWGRLDYLILDLPPGTGDIQLTLAQQVALDGAIIVTTPQVLSLVDVARGILMFEKVNVPVLGVVENMAWFECDDCGKVHHPFGSQTSTLKDRFGLDMLAQLPILPALSDVSERTSGAQIGAFQALAGSVHRAVGMRRQAAQKKPEVKAGPGCVIVAWPDGEESHIPNRTLRLACRCAHCVEEYSGKPILNPDAVPGDIAVEEIQPLGHYAVSIAWSDGHSTSIYSWDHLREVAENLAGGRPDACRNCDGCG
jgi:ATP-binding protein involved in chromosome partitioning